MTSIFDYFDPTVVEPISFEDRRGKVLHFSDMNFSGAKRIYFIKNASEAPFRGWHGHLLEHKVFSCVSGSVKIRSVAISEPETVSPKSEVASWTLREDSQSMLSIPGGYANSIEALSPGSVVMVLSNRTIVESEADDYRWPADYFKQL